MISKDKNSLYSNILTSESFSEIDDDDLDINKELNQFRLNNNDKTNPDTPSSICQVSDNNLQRYNYPDGVYDSIDKKFDLPLKNNNVLKQNRNFGDLLDDPLWNELNNAKNKSLDNEKKLSNNNNNKKVRFNDFNNNMGDITNHIYTNGNNNNNLSRDTSNVELLLQNANECNDFLNDNLTNLNSKLFLSTSSINRNVNKNSNNNNGLYRSVSELGTTRTESLSNFDLSENDLNSQNNNIGNNNSTNLSINNIDVNIDNILRNENLNNSNLNIGKVKSNDSQFSEGMNIDEDIDDFNSDVKQIDKETESVISNLTEELCREKVMQYLERKDKRDTINGQDNKELLDSNYAIHLVAFLYNPLQIDPEDYKISVDETIQNFIKTLNLIIKLSNFDANVNASSNENYQNSTIDEYRTFTMKNLPSITFEELIYRIQNKCMFGSIIYETATYLLQILLLTRDVDNFGNGISNNDNENIDNIPIRIKLKHILPMNQIHRIVIATIRISGKLTEDSLHSHNYFCKVVGITKKLLSRLESTLLNCLKNDSLIITNEKLSASIMILHHLEEMANTISVGNTDER